MGSIKDRNGLGLKEAEDIKKRWQEYTEELYKKDLHDQDNHDLGVITHLEPDILECEVKWALESITMNKASGGDGIPVELVQILKDDPLKVLHSIYQKIWKTQQRPQDWKRSVFIPTPKKGNAKSVVSDSVQPHRRQPMRLPSPWDYPGKNTGVGCHFFLQGVKVKSLIRVRLLATPWTVAYQAPLSMGFSRQEYWSRVPLPSLLEKLKYP